MANLGSSSLGRDWSSLPSELLVLVLKKLSFANITRLKAVCSFWGMKVKSYIESSSYSPPCLLLCDVHCTKLDDFFHFFSIEDNLVFKLKNMPTPFVDSLCMGSSHGWLLFLDNNFEFYLFHPFSNAHLPLPYLDTFPDVVNVYRFSQSCFLSSQIMYKDIIDATEKKITADIFLVVNFVVKVVISREPSSTKNDVGVWIMYAFGEPFSEFGYHKLAFCMLGDNKWISLNGECKDYQDIVASKNGNSVYALRSEGRMEVWNSYKRKDCTPIKTKEIVAPLPSIISLTLDENDQCCHQNYLAENVSGEVLLLVRYFSGVHRLPCDTLFFHVFKLDFEAGKWKEVESLGECAVFLGGNHTAAFSVKNIQECQENSIYFTDDYWLLSLFHNVFDSGVFNLEGKDSVPYFGLLPNEETSVLWIVPNH